MADTVFFTAIPDLKAYDLGDGTFGMAVSNSSPAAGIDMVFERTDPPLKAIDLGDETYALAVVLI